MQHLVQLEPLDGDEQHEPETGVGGGLRLDADFVAGAHALGGDQRRGDDGHHQGGAGERGEQVAKNVHRRFFLSAGWRLAGLAGKAVDGADHRTDLLTVAGPGGLGDEHREQHPEERRDEADDREAAGEHRYLSLVSDMILPRSR
jgi:hypothetical protein